MKPQYLAIDLGSSNGKIVSAWLDQDKKLKMQEVGRFPTPRVFVNGHVCTEIYEIYGFVCRTLSEMGRKGIEIKSVGADSWSSDFCMVTPRGELAGLPVFYRDKRTNGMMSEVEKVISYRDLYRLTTQRRIQDASLCQLLAIKKEDPSQLEGGNKLMCLGDLLMYFFTGKICSEVSVASYTQMFNMHDMCWENRVFDMFGIPRAIQPEVVQAADCLGSISEEHAKHLGVNRFEIIAPAVHDTSSAGVAVPVDGRKNWAYLATGSWYLVSMELEKPADPELSYHFNLSNTGLAFGKTLLKRNVCAMWIIQECRRMWQSAGYDCDYPVIAALAGNAKPFYAMIDPDDVSFYNPENMVESVLQFLIKTGQKVPAIDDIGQIARIIYESIAFKCRYSLEALKKTTGRCVDTLYTVGGSSNVAFLNQMISSALNIMLLTGPQEASAVGNILLQAVGSGELGGEEEIREVVRRTFPIHVFYPENPQEWDNHYQEFLQICGLDLIQGDR